MSRGIWREPKCSPISPGFLFEALISNNNENDGQGALRGGRAVGIPESGLLWNHEIFRAEIRPVLIAGCKMTAKTSVIFH